MFFSALQPPYSQWLFFHGCRDCRVGDRLEICAWTARDPCGRRDRTGQLHCRSARVCYHLCHCRCRIGDTDRESPRANGSQDVKLFQHSISIKRFLQHLDLNICICALFFCLIQLCHELAICRFRLAVAIYAHHSSRPHFSIPLALHHRLSNRTRYLNPFPIKKRIARKDPIIVDKM